jgi:hypothetical protein
VVARLHRNEYLIVDNGVIDRPGEPSGAIPLKFARKPPGTI